MRTANEKYSIRSAIISILLLSLATLGCSGGKTASGKKVEIPKVCCVISIDGSASYEHLEQAKATVLRAIVGLQDSSKVYVRFITEDSMNDKAGIVSFIIPPEPVKPANTFNVQAKNRYLATAARYAAMKRKIGGIIGNAPSPRAGHTDIYGALLAASVRFENSEGMAPLIIMLTDMLNNVKTYSNADIDLRGAAVWVLNYESSPEGQKVKNFWTDYCVQHGAEEVLFLPMDEPLSFERSR